METIKSYRAIFYEFYSKTQVNIDGNSIFANLKYRKSYINNVIKKYFPKNKDIKILDLGCGYGAFLYFLKNEGYLNFEGIDASPEQIKFSKEVGLENLLCGDLLKELKSKADHSYDFIISFDVLEHFTKYEILEIVKEVYRVLKPNGKYLIHVPNGGAIFSGVVFNGDFTHETCFTDKSLKQLFSICGFRNVESYEDYPVIHGVKSFIRYALWKIVRGLYKFMYMVESGSNEKIILSQNILCEISK